MQVNKLLKERHDPLRCTGRTTALALDAIARAIGKHQSYVYARDHHRGPLASKMFAARIEQLIKQLGLQHVTVTVILGVTGQYDGCVRLNSEIWE